MMQRKPGLPSLDGLRYFDAAARNLSFTRAAQDLFLTQSAVSQKIQSLEQQLGYLVFHRTPAGLRLTPQGEQLFIGVRQAFAILETTLHQTGEETLEGTIKIRVMPSFATKWLLPRLHQFYEQYPISLEIDADMTPANFKSDAVDIAITPFWIDDKNLIQRHLFNDVIYPVISPDLLKTRHLRSYSELCGLRLLHDSMPQNAYSTHWRSYFARLGLYDLNVEAGTGFSRADLVLQAACAGQGIALSRHSLCATEVSNGALIRPFTDIVEDGQVWLTCPRNNEKRPRVQALINWLTEETARHIAERTQILSEYTLHKAG
ncbi:TPA: LysR substrate-binding domain-containing protein [Raoultella planticola]